MKGKKNTSAKPAAAVARRTEEDYDNIIQTLLAKFDVKLQTGQAAQFCLEKEEDLTTWEKSDIPADKLPRAKLVRISNTDIPDIHFTESDRGTVAHVVLMTYTNPERSAIKELYHRNVELLQVNGQTVAMNFCK